MRLPRLWLIFPCVGVAAMLPAATFDDRVEALFRPPLAELAALSPDGQRVAYTARSGGELTIAILHLDAPVAKRVVAVELRRDTAAADVPPASGLRFLRWATPTRLVFAPAERVFPLPPVKDKRGRPAPNPDGPTIVSPIMAVDADGQQHGTLVDARDFLETPDDVWQTPADLLLTPMQLAAARKEPVRWRMPHLDILGFVPGAREQLIIATRGGYNSPRQHAIDIRTGSVTMFGGNWPSPPGETQVFDWHRLRVVGEKLPGAHPATQWRDEELATVQRELESKFPRRVVEVLDWSETRARILFRVTGGGDPGRVFVFQRLENLVPEILRCAPTLPASALNETRFFEFDAFGDVRLSGYVTWPREPRTHPPPVLVVFPSGFPGFAQPPFDPEAQVFADLGFVVARLNHRCVASMKPADVSMLRGALDRVSVNDATAVLAWLAAQHPARPFDRARVITLGRGLGGYLAVRALQLSPEVFRGGIAIDAPMDLRAWLPAAGHGQASSSARRAGAVPDGLLDADPLAGKKLSVVEQVETLTNPLLLLTEPKANPAVDASHAALQARLKRLGRTVEHVALDPGFADAQPKSRAAVYRKIEDFLRRHRVTDAGPTPPGQNVE